MRAMINLLLPLALELQFVGPCDSKPMLTVEVSDLESTTVGDLTVNTLDDRGIPYQGTRQGLNSAFGTPIGREAMEIIGPQEMRSYGWCYEVDGVSPEFFPHEYTITKLNKTVRWYFAYAHYLNGEWIRQCAPAHEIRPAFLCD